MLTPKQEEKTERQIVILYAGRDPGLLVVRRLLLEHARCVVTTAATYQAFAKEFDGGDFDGVVLCSSVKNTERRKMALLVLQHSPSTPVIVISEGPFSQYNFGTITVDPQPESLLTAIAEAVKGPHRRRSA